MFNMAEIIKKIRFLAVGKYIDNDPCTNPSRDSSKETHNRSLADNAHREIKLWAMVCVQYGHACRKYGEP